MIANEKILITGPASQVAFPIACALAVRNEVYGLARFSDPGPRARLEAVGVRCLQADLAQDSLTSIPDDFTYGLNFAVTRSGLFDYDLASNAEGAGRLMFHCRKVKAWLHCSSSAVYQYAGRHPLKETDPLGDSRRSFMPTYSLCKIAAEVLARFAARQWNIPTTIARLNVPYGDNGGLPAYHLDWMLAGTPIALHPDKPSLRNLIHEDDYIAHIPKLLAMATVPATTINWGGSQAVGIEEWCIFMEQLTGLTAQFTYTQDAIGSIVLDLTRMHACLGRTTIDWHDGIRRMIRARHPELRLRAARGKHDG